MEEVRGSVSSVVKPTTPHILHTAYTHGEVRPRVGTCNSILHVHVSARVCACVCMCVYMCMHVCVRVYACVCTCVCMCVYVCMHVCVRVYACVCTCVCTHVCACVQECMQVYVCTVHTKAHTLITWQQLIWLVGLLPSPGWVWGSRVSSGHC